MQIDFYINFTKRQNSTKRPVEGGIVTKHTLTGYLKEPCSVMNPVINIQEIPIQNAPCVFTYAWIPTFYRYYFVKDWVWNDGLWTVHLEVDVLATYRPHIGDTYAYIERCAGVASGVTDRYFNGRIVDKQYPTTTEYSKAQVNISAVCPWSGWDIENGCYVLGIISRTTLNNVGGAVQYYALTQTQIRQLLEYMLNDQFYNDAGFQNNQQVDHNLAKCLVNPIQYITSCFWFPTSVSSFTLASDTTIKVGPWTTIGTGKPIIDRVGYSENFSITLPTHPQASTRGEYLNYAPFSKYLCTLAPFGSFMIDPAWCADNKTIKFTAQIDGITGKACLQICREDTIQGSVDFFHLSTAMFGVPIQLSQVGEDWLGSIKSLVQAGTGVIGAGAQAVMGNYVGAMHSGMMALNSVGNAVESAMPVATSEGVNGSFIAFERLTGTFDRLTALFSPVVDEDNTELGRPLCEVRQIKNLAGYVKCGEATVDYYAFDDELTQIHNHLLRGFFWE